jgi:hypothetical protein
MRWTRAERLEAEALELTLFDKPVAPARHPLQGPDGLRLVSGLAMGTRAGGTVRAARASARAQQRRTQQRHRPADAPRPPPCPRCRRSGTKRNASSFTWIAAARSPQIAAGGRGARVRRPGRDLVAAWRGRCACRRPRASRPHGARALRDAALALRRGALTTPARPAALRRGGCALRAAQQCRGPPWLRWLGLWRGASGWPRGGSSLCPSERAQHDACLPRFKEAAFASCRRPPTRAAAPTACPPMLRRAQPAAGRSAKRARRRR